MIAAASKGMSCSGAETKWDLFGCVGTWSGPLWWSACDSFGSKVNVVLFFLLFFSLEFEINTQLSISSVEQVLKHFMSTDTSVMRSKCSFDEMTLYNCRTRFHLRSICSVIGLKHINVGLNQNIWISEGRILNNQPRQWAWKRPDLSLYPTDVLLVSNQFLPAEFSHLAPHPSAARITKHGNQKSWIFMGRRLKRYFHLCVTAVFWNAKYFFLNILFMPSKSLTWMKTCETRR